jgi:hypothetical protein
VFVCLEEEEEEEEEVFLSVEQHLLDTNAG